MHALASAFHSSSPFCFDRASTAGQSAAVTSVTSTTTSFDFNHRWPSSTIGTPRSFANNSIGVHVDKTESKEPKKMTVTSIIIDETDESQRIAASAIKRLSTEELENMVQNQLEKVINGHRYNTWLRKQVDDTDIQLVKYQNRIDALQKHVNDLSVVIHKHTKGSDGMITPPTKLTRNVGLQVRIKQPDRIPIYEGKGVQKLPSSTSSGEESSASIDASVSCTAGKDRPTPTSTSAVQMDQHCTANSNDVYFRIESHQTSSISMENDLAHVDKKAAKSPIFPTTSTLVPIYEDAILLPKKILGTQTGVSPTFISSLNSVIVPSLTVTQAMDLTTDRKMPAIPSDYVRSFAPPLVKSKSDNATGLVLAGKPSSPRQSAKSAGLNPSVEPSTTPSRTVIMFPASHEVTALRSPSSFETYPPSGSLAQYVPVAQKSPSNDFHSHPERKRRLVSGITSFDASTIASVEKYHKLIKQQWYNSKTHHSGGLPSHAHPSAIHENRMLQLEVPNDLVGSRAIASPVFAQVATPIQSSGMQIRRRTQQQTFEKTVKSVGIYRTWKLPFTAGPEQQMPCVQHPLLLQPQPQQVQQFPNVRTWIPLNPPLSDSFPLQEGNLTKKRCSSDLTTASSQPPGPAPIQPGIRTCGSLASPKIHNHNPAQLHCAKPDRRKRNLPDLIAIPNEGVITHSASYFNCLNSS